MTAAPRRPSQAIDVTFTATVISDSNSGWLCVQMPSSAEFFGTGRSVKVGGTVDGQNYQATMLPVGGGTHMMPLRAPLREVLRKGLGDDVTVHFTDRYS